MAGWGLALPAVAATNIVFFLVDDLGYMDVGFNNPACFYETPRLDALARGSMRFTAAYAASPVCSPTRSSVLTGRYPARTRNTDYFGAPNGFERIPEGYRPERDGRFGRFAERPLWPAPYVERLDAAHVTLAEAFKAAGHATMLAGKWHLGPEGSYPEDHGFDVNAGGHEAGGPYGAGKYFTPYGNPRLPDGPPGEHLPDRLATEVAKFIGNNRDRPFFVYLPFYSVHNPMIGRPDLVAKYQAKKKRLGLEAAFAPEGESRNRTVQEHAVYAAMVEAMDQAVGKVLDALETHGVAERTIVVFFADNGGLSTAEGSPTSNLPFRGGKGWAYEGGIREPLLVRWPGVTRAGSTSDAPLISTDFYPTLLEACGLEARPEQHADGTSFAGLLRDPGSRHRRPPLFWHYPHWGNQGGSPFSALRDGDWKLIRFHGGKGTELYHLGKDPGERSNLADELPDEVARLGARLDGYLAETKALPCAVNPRPGKPDR
jgi:arylsulfatase A-like enzyme